jgi:hypothetical protein
MGHLEMRLEIVHGHARLQGTHRLYYYAQFVSWPRFRHKTATKQAKRYNE